MIDRARTNRNNYLQGGTPCDNGRVEYENHNLKTGVGGYVRPCYSFIMDLTKYIGQRSKDDLSFGPKLSAQVKGYKFNARSMKIEGTLRQNAMVVPEEDVTVTSSSATSSSATSSSSSTSASASSAPVYSRTYDRVTPLDFVWDYGNHGKSIMATWDAIAFALKSGEKVDATKGKVPLQQDDKRGMRMFFERGTQKEGQWLRKYEELINPETTESAIANIFKGYSRAARPFPNKFDAVHFLCSLFVVRTPLLDKTVLASHLERISAGDLTTASLSFVMNLGREGLQMCSCEDWLRYTWCPCSCADARRKKIIVCCSKKNDPNQSKPTTTKVFQLKKARKKAGIQKKRGAPEKINAQGGGRWKKQKAGVDEEWG